MHVKSQKRLQRGISLIESMVAIVVMALGILGILGVQMRTLAETQTSVRRAQAIRLIEDLSERMKVNPSAMANISEYTFAFGTTPATYTPACISVSCSNKALAKDDMEVWRQFVKTTLPAADASIFITEDEKADPKNRRQLGVMISWRENEKTNSADYKKPFNDATTASTGGAATCPTDRTCHLQYVQLSARCAAYAAGPTIQYFCPTSKT
jgi:type IV pilus assembly protein PilV